MPGLGNSAERLTRTPAGAATNVHFEQGNIAQLRYAFDLIYPNVARHWLPAHPVLPVRPWTNLNPGGLLAGHAPAHHDHASHRLLAETSPDFSAELGRFARCDTVQDSSPVLTPGVPR